MTALLGHAMGAARALPQAAQDDIALLGLRLAERDGAPPVTLSNDERAAITTSKDAAVRGGFASDDQVRAVWAKHGL